MISKIALALPLLNDHLASRNSGDFEDALARGCFLENAVEHLQWLEAEADNLQRIAIDAGETKLADYFGKLVETAKGLASVFGDERGRRMDECARFERVSWNTPLEAVRGASPEVPELVFISRFPEGGQS